MRKKANPDGQAYVLTWVTDALAVGYAPLSVPELASIREQGISAIMNLCAEFCDLPEAEERHGFEVYYMPIPDEEAPELKELEKALAWLDETLYKGKKVLIHCRYGIGRTGTVLNAYLLRRGLGSKEAGKVLRSLRSKPESFAQWRTLRQYGKQSGRLTVREPSLEFKRVVDLGPFLDDYRGLVDRAEDVLSMEVREPSRCGRGHTRCCRTPVRLELVEAVHIAQTINLGMTSEDRMRIIDRAVLTARSERETARASEPSGEACLADAGAVCPLLEEGQCMVFAKRPLQCRTFELPEETDAMLWEDLLQPALRRLSLQIFFAFTSEFVEASPPDFSLADVASGKYVETFFHFLMRSGAA